MSQPVPSEAPRGTAPQVRPQRGDRDTSNRRARARGRGGRAIPPPVPTHTPDDDAVTPAAPALPEVNNAGEPTQASTSPSKPQSAAAVRGDRSQTGGLTRPRLTEEELSAKLEAARLNNVKREEAHRAAEADEASFRAQEAQAHERRKEDTLNRKRMEAEREKNRARKLAGRGGREWDEGKEEDTGRGRGRGYRRGMHGSVQGPDGSMNARGPGDAERGRTPWDGEDEVRSGRQRGDYNGRGRGERGAGAGRGRGRARGGAPERATAGQAPSFGDAHFPALGKTQLSEASLDAKDGEHWQSKVEGDARGTQHMLEPPSSSARARHGRSPWRVTDEPKTSWADQVEEGN